MNLITLLACFATLAGAGTGSRRPDPVARALVEQALDRMGGVTALGAIDRVRYQITTQWQPTSFAPGPYADQPVYETDTDVRDYSIGGWRNTRRIWFGDSLHILVDLVRDSVAVRDFGHGPAPLNVAYVDERQELFSYTPDRLLLALYHAPDLQPLPDTSLAQAPATRVRGSVNGMVMTLYLRKSDGLPAMVAFRAAAPNDFGLVPWGAMAVEVWYSSWHSYPGGLNLPTQWDVTRVGRPYKRITVEAAVFNPDFAPDSFAVSDSLRQRFEAVANRPMHDIPLDSARVVDRFVEFRTFGAPSGAVRLGDAWVLLESGQAPLSVERALAWMSAHAPGRIAFALLGTVSPANGGAPVLQQRGVRLLAGAGAAPYVRRILRNHGLSDKLELLPDAGWVPVGGDSIRIERLDLPNDPGSIIAWVPSLRWIWAPDASSPLDLSLVRARARARGWDPQWIGWHRDILRPAE